LLARLTTSTPPAVSASTSSGTRTEVEVLVNHLAALRKRTFEIHEKDVGLSRDLPDLLEAAADGLVRCVFLPDLFVHVLLIVTAQRDIPGNEQGDVAPCAHQRGQEDSAAQKCREASEHA
jgi:hypothetical protein